MGLSFPSTGDKATNMTLSRVCVHTAEKDHGDDCPNNSVETQKTLPERATSYFDHGVFLS